MSATAGESGIETPNGRPFEEHGQEFAWRLFVRMVAADLTPPELAEQSDVPVRTIERWLTGAMPRFHRPAINNVHAVARVMRTTALYLLTGETR